MKFVKVSVLSMLLGCFVMACSAAGGGHGHGGGSGSGGESGTGSGGAAPDNGDGFSVTVAAIAQTKYVDFIAPTGGEFVLIKVTIRNDGASSPIHADPSRFSLKTGDNVLIAATTDAELLPKIKDACADVAVAEGGSLTCVLAFDTKAGEHLTSLEYDDSDLHAEAPITAMTKEPGCFPLLTYYDADDVECSNCVDPYVSNLDGICFDGDLAKLDACAKEADPCACEAAKHVGHGCAKWLETSREEAAKMCVAQCGF